MENHHHCPTCGDMIAPTKQYCNQHSKDKKEKPTSLNTEETKKEKSHE